jgi:hypothetical protein
MKYAFDIDNTLVNTNGSDYSNCTPIKYRIDKLNRLYDAGNTIYLFTARGSRSGNDYRKMTEDQMNQFGVKYHKLIFGKPDVDLFIDDKAISAIDWDNISNTI